MDQHLLVKRKHDKLLEQNWKDKIQFNKKYLEWKLPLLNMMDAFARMWGGHLGRVIAAKDRIHLTKPTNTPIHQSPYPACARHCELEKTKIDEMLAEVVREPASTETALPICVCGKEERIPLRLFGLLEAKCR